MSWALATPQVNHDLLWAALITGALTFMGVIVVAVLARSNNKVAKAVAADILSELSLDNGHTAGQALARLETKQAEIANQVDAIEMRQAEDAAMMREHIAADSPMVDWVRAAMEKEGHAEA